MKKNIYVLGLVLFLMGGCFDINAFSKLNSAEKNMNNKERKKLVAFMNLKTMFPDPQVRALAKAAANGNIEKINKLVNLGLDVNAKGTSNATPLYWAMNNINGFKHLLKLGADPNIAFDDGSSVMSWAVNHENSDFLKLALKYGGNPNLTTNISGESLLFDAMGPDNKEKIPILINAGANINFQSNNGETLMMVAAGLGQFDTVYQLLQMGANYQLRNNYTHGTLMDDIAFSRRTMDPNSNLTLWMKKVINWLHHKGVEIPEWKPGIKKIPKK